MNAVLGPAPLYGLETIHPLQPTQNYFQLIGWAFLPGSTTPNEVRVVIGDRVFPPLERIQRADVASTYPNEPHAGSAGFKFICYLPFGFYTGFLEVSAEGQPWTRVCTLAIPVSAHPILGAVEKPVRGALITQAVRVEGWCFHPEFTVSQILLQFGNVEMRCDYRIERQDVAKLFPEHPAARYAGFITSENLPRGAGRIKIRATTDCGRVFSIDSQLEAEIKEGWAANPPPPSAVRDLSTLALAPSSATQTRLGGPRRGDRNILFALYGDFTSNSALHVASLANELIALGYDCVVAVPHQKETIGALPRANFMAVEFDELPSLSTYFKDGRGPSLIHGWTSRENVRKFCERVVADFGSDLFVHLEDNEQDILAKQLQKPFAELAAQSDAQLDPWVGELSHPRRAQEFLGSATGVTVIVDRLTEHVPPGRPTIVLWPASASGDFQPRPRDDRLRSALGIALQDVVLFYHGNTHPSNAEEVGQLYQAVELLNQRGIRTILIRTGRDYPGFRPYAAGRLSQVIHLGHIARASHLPAIMALADYFVQPGLPDPFNDFRFPSKLPEFFSLGRPVILPATNIGSVVRHGEDAWVLPQADASAIAGAIEALENNPEVVDRLSKGAIAFSEQHFSWPRTARRLVDFYRSLTALAPPSSS